MVVVKYGANDRRRYVGLVRHVGLIGESDLPLSNCTHWQELYDAALRVPGEFRSREFGIGLGKLEMSLERSRTPVTKNL
tara:strand:- start:687 stop:923 length:237 start_codon:yes stop_codon:yes gene_type:complete